MGYFCFLRGKVKYSDLDIHDGWFLREKMEGCRWHLVSAPGSWRYIGVFFGKFDVRMVDKAGEPHGQRR